MEVISKDCTKEFAYLRKRANKWFGVAAIMFFGIVLGFAWLGNAVGLVFGVGFMASLVRISFIWKCPSCGHDLGRDMSPKFCSECGSRFQ
jgi:hypothetical protein